MAESIGTHALGLSADSVEALSEVASVFVSLVLSLLQANNNKVAAQKVKMICFIKKFFG
jgi:hypothetical protein